MPRRLQALLTVSWILWVVVAGALAQQPQTYVQQAGSGLAPSVAAFPNLSLASGNVLCGTATVTYAGGGVTALQNGVNYVYFDCGTSVPKSSTSPFTGGQIPLAVVVARSGSYGTSGLLDVRPWAVARTEPTTTGPVSALNVAGTTGLTWTSGGDNLGLATFGTPATGGSLYINTPSLNSSFQSGLGIDGTYGSPSQQSVINIRALGVHSGGGYGSQLAFWTTNGTALNQQMTIDKGGNVGIGTTSPSALFSVGSGSPFQVNTSGGMTATAGQTLSGGLTENGGPTYSLSGASESGNTVTFATTTTCGIMAGQVVTVSGVTPTDYNGTYRPASGCGGGSSFTVLNPKSGLSGGSGGTATAGPLFNFGMSLPSTLTVLGDNTTPSSNPFQVAMAPLDLYSYRTTTISTANTLARPQVYIGRSDSSVWGTSQCANLPAGGPAAACDEPLLLVMGTNGTTGNATPALVAIEGYVYGGASNVNNPDRTSNFHVGGVFRADDASTANTVNLRGINVLALVSGYPTLTGPGNFTRSAAGIENDVNNNSGNDAVFGSAGGTGNFLVNYSAVSLGGHNLTAAYGFGSSSSPGYGWLTGISGSGAVNCGLCLSNGNGVTTTTGIHLTTGGGAGTYGMVVGSGTQTEVGIGNVPSQGSPNVGILLDAQGTAGTSETKNSNSLVIRAKTSSSTGTDWTLAQSGTDNKVDLQGPAASNAANYSFVLGDSSSRKLELGYGGTLGIAGSKLPQAQIVWGQVGYAGDLLIGSRGNEPTNIIFYNSPDAGTTGLVERVRVNSAGYVSIAKAVGAGVNPVTGLSPTFDLSKGNIQQYTCPTNGGNVSPTFNFNGLSSLVPGEVMTLIFVQPASGTTCSVPSWPSNIHGASISTSNSTVSVQTFVVSNSGSNLYATSAVSICTTGCGTP